MIQQTTFTLRARARGFHLVTDEVLSHLPALPKTGLLNLFIQHTSAGLSVNENCDPDVRSDMEKIFNNLVRERESWYDHTLEGWDDMPAHAKSSLVGASLSIPITDGRLNLGTWIPWKAGTTCLPMPNPHWWAPACLSPSPTDD